VCISIVNFCNRPVEFNVEKQKIDVLKELGKIKLFVVDISEINAK